ncbi:hypothetical protein [Nocardia brasiliensis]|uniref:hypothetical protein n=1 Tax=Nocardia brasiliensis TaxID=37326 RepID=UPI003D9335E0
MTTVAAQGTGRRQDRSGNATALGLREFIFGADYRMQMRVREIVMSLGDRPPSGLTYAQETAIAPVLLRRSVAVLGGSCRAVAADYRLRGAVCDWSAVAAPRLLPVLTGHFDLAIGGIERLGNGSSYQREALAELDRALAVGVLAHTELGGTNGPDVQTVATWDRKACGFRLRTPHMAAAKFMANVASTSAAKTILTTARVIVDGHDEGVFAFLLRLRSADAVPAEGVGIVELPEKSWAPMDHAMLRFDDILVPKDALLGGNWATIDSDGVFSCEVGKRERFRRTIAALQSGRIDLATAAVASARAALAVTLTYARQRVPAGGIRMIDRDAVQRDLISGVASVYAMTAFGAHVRARVGTGSASDPCNGVWAMLAKPLLTCAAREVLAMCRRRSAAQGSLRCNYITDWEGCCEAILTAEGETQTLQAATGRLPRQVMLSSAAVGLDISQFRIAEVDDRLPWWNDILADRVLAVAMAVKQGRYEGLGAMGADSAAIEMSVASAERLAAECLTVRAREIADPRARALVSDLAAVYALECIGAHGLCSADDHGLAPRVAAKVEAELAQRRAGLAEHLPALVDAFEVPDLGAPMQSRSYLEAWRRLCGWDDMIELDAHSAR